MAVVIITVSQFVFDSLVGVRIRNTKLKVSGLPANQNTVIPHGLVDGAGNPVIPIQVGLEPKSNSVFWEYQDADGTNIYIGVGAATGNHAVDIYLVG